ncbi:hypothetical protein NRIC_17660 [Enterococcus florum]|uniref:Signal peptidase I n=1 Tax=Enterococcus florum TaxID=2480627 RepID=A0A4P5P7C2_9ENTE|nr:signal peptidase I [Enterococcus florum]GCF93875.1 hypothetical protein NRIC_17660 [Enterococcus florum]
MKKKVYWFFNLIFWVLLIAIVGAAVMFRFSDKTDKSLFGYRIYTVATNSMNTEAPLSERFKGQSFEKGDVIVVKIKKAKDIVVDDVVTFVPTGIEDGSVYLTHRVVSVDEKKDTFITRGDANNMDDPEISGKQIIGTVQFATPFVGRLLEFIRDNLVLSIGVGAVFLLSIGMIQRKFFT